MLQHLHKFIKPLLTGIFFLLCLSVFLIHPTYADTAGYDINSGSSDSTTWGGKAEDIQGRMGLGNDDPRNIIANIINIALGFLGIIALVVIMYAGFLWMNSGGNSDQINKAKKILINGVIGLIIVLSAFAIASFVLDAIFRATTGNNYSNSGNTLPLTGGGGGGGGGVGGNGGMNLPCSASTDTCSPDDSKCSELGPMWSCGSKCLCVVDNLGSCYNEVEDVCNYPCSAGVKCLGGNGCYDNHPTDGCGQGDSSCQCCCDPNDDQCGVLYPTLKCKKDSGSCSGEERGLCCGCTSDKQCGSPSQVGCGSDTCCNNRPEVVGVTPVNSATEVCTNALISVKFTQAMKSSNLAENFLVVGDYGTDPCPSGTRLVSAADFNIPTLLQERNYCAVDGGYATRNSSTGNFVDFATKSFLRINTQYHVIIKGDMDINNDIDEGILNYWGISMNGPQSGSWSSTFRTIDDKSGSGGVCVIESVVLTPPAHLINVSANSVREKDGDASEPTFDTVSDKDKLFEAQAISRGGQVIVPVTGYNWDWDIISTVSSVVSFNTSVINLPSSSRLAQVVDGVTDGRSQIVATVDMDNYASTNSNMEGNGFSDTSDVYVFICNNPWPPINTKAIPSWQPWKPSPNDYNYEIYYCRDKGSKATVDDLPAFDSAGINNSYSDNQVRQQVYFTYKEPPAPGTILEAVSAPADSEFPDGGVVYLEWTAASSNYADITGYKVYWGENSKNYLNSLDVGAETKVNISGLVNGNTYYFSVTAYTGDRAESAYYPEKSAIPLDNVGPLEVPTFLAEQIKVNPTEIVLVWSEVESAYSYEFAYGVQSGIYGVVENVQKDNGISVTGLTPGKTYYFGIKSLDASGNGSDFYNTYATSTIMK